MITDFVLNAIFGGIDALLSLAPNVGAPDTSAEVQRWNFALLDASNRVIPTKAMATVLLALLALKVAMLAFDAVVFVYHQFWGSQ